MKVSEIFASIEGEGIRTGYPAIFIRLFGCNIKCSYCDSQYACVGPDYKEMSVIDILNVVTELTTRYNIYKVTLTGGEPLIQDPDVYKLIEALTSTENCEIPYEVNIETNGAVSIDKVLQLPGSDNVIITMDWKSISSGMSDHMLVSNLSLLRDQDVLKFVVGCPADLDQMSDILEKFSGVIKCNIFVSPIFDRIEPKRIVQYILDNSLTQVRVQIQIHKIIWDPTMRGV